MQAGNKKYELRCTNSVKFAIFGLEFRDCAKRWKIKLEFSSKKNKIHQINDFFKIVSKNAVNTGYFC